MQLERFTVYSKMDQLAISVIRVTPEGKVKGVLQIVHGMSEYKERYLPFMEYLAGHGYASVIHDHRGHGESVRDKDDLGYMYENGAESIVEDVKLVNDFVKESFPDKPCFLMGHSMGSMVARAYTKKYDDTINGLIVCGSPSHNRLAPLAAGLTKIGSMIAGEKKRAKWIDFLMFGQHNKGITNPASKNSWICANEATVAAYDEDELCGFIFTYNGMENLVKLMRMVYTKRGWEVKNPSMPVHFIAGKEDPCLISEEKFVEAVDHMRAVGYGNVSSVLYPGMRHEILNETNNIRVYDDIVARLDLWMDR